MAVDTWGPNGEPQFIDTGAPAIAVDPTAVAAYAAMVGGRIRGTSGQRTANVFPNSSGKPITDGIEWYETDTGDTYLRDQGAWWFKESRNTLTLPAPQTGWTTVSGTQTVRVGRLLFFHWVFTKNAAVTLPNELILVLPSGLRPVDTAWPFAAVVTGGSEGPSMVSISSADGGVRLPVVPPSGARSFKIDGHFFLI